MQIVSFKAEVKEGSGKKSAKAVRNAGRIPGELYGGDENIHFSFKKKDVKPLIYSGEFKLAKIEISGKEHNCIVKAVQFHPVTDEIVHMDFLKLVDNTPIKVDLPIRFKGVSPGEKEGGKLTQTLRRVNIKTTPEHLVDKLLVDISGLELGNSVRIRDLELGEGIEVMNPEGTPIASVEVPRVLKEADLELEGLEGEETEGAAEGEAAPEESKES